MLVRACKLKNFGDTLNSELIRLISGIVPTIVNNKFQNPNNETIYMAIGSVLGWCDEFTEVWGSGFISNSQFITSIPKAKKIHAVRGKLTREILLKRGIECPAVYGDPALLMPRFYNPELPKKYKLSVIPHHVDKVLIPELKKQYPTAHFIDIQQDVYKFIDEVIQSEYIISSALHGLIMADAYGVPNEWKEFSKKVLGHGFKFRDYESSKGLVDLDKLLEVCPFRRKDEE